jgi:hypothetical protein
MRSYSLAAAALFAVFLAPAADAADLQVFCPPLVRDGLDKLAIAFTAQTGTHVTIKSEVGRTGRTARLVVQDRGIAVIQKVDAIRDAAQGEVAAGGRERAGHMLDAGGGDYVDLLAGPSPDSERLRIRGPDLERYTAAIIRFWGLADRQVGAVVEFPAFGFSP